MFFYLLPFLLAMGVAIDNGVYVSNGIRVCMWIAIAGTWVIEMLKLFKK